MQRDTLQHLEQEHRNLQAHARDLDERVRQCEQALRQHGRLENDLRLRVQRAEDLAEKRQDELERDTVQDGRLDALIAGLKEAEEEKTLHEGSYQDAIISKEKYNEVAKQLNEEIKTFDDEIKEITAKIKKAEMKASRLAQTRYTALQEKNQAVQAIQDAREDKQREEEKRQRQADRTAHFVSQASQVAARVPIDPNETARSLDQKLTKLSEDLERFERQSVLSPSG